MKILDVRAMRGPNYWSAQNKQLIVVKLDMEESEDYPTNMIDGFLERIQSLMPSLYHHRCMEMKAGGFFERVRTGTSLAHVVEHVALELQSLAGMLCGFGRTRMADNRGAYHVVFDYAVENAGLYAADAAVAIVRALEADIDYDLEKDIKELMRINRNEGFGPSTQSIIDAAIRKGIPYRRLDNNSLILFGQGINQKILQATMACSTSSIGVEIASDKEETKRVLREGYVPVPDGRTAEDEAGLKEAISSLGFPLVLKPVDGNHGRGITTDIRDWQKALAAFEKAKEVSDEVIIERYIKGSDYRFLVIDHKLEAIARRTPAKVVGNDRSSIQELIDDTNNNPNRGEGHEKTLTKIKVDAQTNSILIEKSLTLSSVLPCGEVLYLKDAANLSSGGTSTDTTDIVHPYNIFLAERIARLMDLDICGIDIIAADIAQPITEQNGAVLEVNAGPGFRMHLSPSKGQARDVGEPVIKMLYPKGFPSRIPLVAVTGTKAKQPLPG